MRVITGLARGVKLITLTGEETRPTNSRVKEGVFSAINHLLHGAEVLDLFAGSGQMGIEALSRGAKRCVFVDNNPNAVDIIKKNLVKTRFENVRVVQSDYRRYLKSCDEKFDIVFIDPPFGSDADRKSLKLLPDILSHNATVIHEHSSDMTAYDDALEIHKEYKYGRIIITVYRRHTT
ncbi:MAG: 16S rRNA (guanine(966)-N(2))-methyltransferase RsmD [Oscillospiraceae bacterium]|nr:16S rRNA (guanine(966)-N(2))-methyltransferase RsmD [Oscillospiraceae bacterium]